MSTDQSLTEHVVAATPSASEDPNLVAKPEAGTQGGEPPQATPAATESESSRGRTFRPAFDPEQAKAIPATSTLASVPAMTVSGSSAETVEQAIEAEAKQAQEGQSGSSRSSAPVADAPPKEKIEIPSKKTELEADLEAEIEAALAGAGSLALGGDETAVAQAAAAATPATGPQEGVPRQGAKVKGTVLSVHGDTIIVDIGRRDSGLIEARQYEGKPLPEVGAVLDLVVEKYNAAEGLINLRLPKAVVSKPAGNWHEVAEGQIVDCMVVKSNKGGLEVSISNLRGFLPAGQVDFGFVASLDQFIGQKLRVKITEVNQAKRNLIVSRRSFLEDSRAEAREEMWKTLEVGQKHMGTVRTIKDYGAFVDIGGVDGLLHVAELSWSRVNHPKDILSEGQQVEVQILGIDREKSKISLGMRQLLANPWSDVTMRYPLQSTVHGKVTKTTDFGAFVELEPGLEGLVHISELDHKRVHRVTDVLQVGKEVDVQVLSVDLDKKRIALSLKSLIAKPMEKAKPTDEDLAPGAGQQYERKRKGPLKGGGTGSGGNLFG